MGRYLKELEADNISSKHIRKVSEWERFGLKVNSNGRLKRSESKKLHAIASNPKNEEIVNYSAWVVSPQLAPYIIKSVAERKTYELLEYDKELGRIPCGRTDFYAYRRKFYMLLLSLSA